MSWNIIEKKIVSFRYFQLIALSYYFTSPTFSFYLFSHIFRKEYFMLQNVFFSCDQHSMQNIEVSFVFH